MVNNKKEKKRERDQESCFFFLIEFCTWLIIPRKKILYLRLSLQ